MQSGKSVLIIGFYLQLINSFRPKNEILANDKLRLVLTRKIRSFISVVRAFRSSVVGKILERGGQTAMQCLKG